VFVVHSTYRKYLVQFIICYISKKNYNQIHNTNYLLLNSNKACIYQIFLVVYCMTLSQTLVRWPSSSDLSIRQGCSFI
jgi:hypothetical protein